MSGMLRLDADIVPTVHRVRATSADGTEVYADTTHTCLISEVPTLIAKMTDALTSAGYCDAVVTMTPA